MNSNKLKTGNMKSDLRIQFELETNTEFPQVNKPNRARYNDFVLYYWKDYTEWLEKKLKASEKASNCILDDVSKCMNNKIELHYSDNFKTLRNAKGYTQKEIALKLEIKRNTYATYEEGRAKPQIDIFYKICCIYSVSMDKMLTTKLKVNIC